MKSHRTSVNLENKQINFLTDFAHQYWKATGKRISTSAVIRALIEHLSGLEKSYQTLLVRSLVQENGDENR